MPDFSLAMARHPDKNKDPEAQEMFIKINDANEVCTIIMAVNLYTSV